MRHLRAFVSRLGPFLTAVLLLAGTVNPVFAQSADPASLDLVSSTRYIVIDANTGEIFAQKDADTRGGMASLTKVFTALVAIERASSLQQQITAQESDAFDSTSTTMTGFVPGVVFTVEDLLYGMMLESGNDAATALARGLAEQPGDSPDEAIARFVGWMNEKVAALGLTNTHFVNPHGLSDPEHYSTPRELAAFTRYALENPAFFQVLTTRTYTTTTGVTITSVNRGPEFMQSYIGGKTGFDEDTGYCLIEVAQRDEVRLVSVTIDGVAPDVWYQDHAVLLEYGFNALADRLAAGEPLPSDLASVAGQEEEPVPTEIVAETGEDDGDVAILAEGDDVDAVGPVRIDGTPVPARTAMTGDDSSIFDNWAIALLLGAVVFGSLVLRSRRTGQTPPDSS